MSEREIRDVLRQFCESLDLRARKNARRAVVPLVVGTGLFVAACDDETNEPTDLYGVPTGSPTATTTGSGGGGGATPSGTSTGSGGAGGESATGGAAGAGGDPGVDYMAPDP